MLEREDLDDESDYTSKSDVNIGNRRPRVKSSVENKLDIIGQAVKIKSLRGEVYHDDIGKRVYGSWK